MILRALYRGRTLKTVTIAGVTDDDTDEDIVNFALAKALETRSSTFAQRIERFSLTPDVVNVYLDID